MSATIAKLIPNTDTPTVLVLLKTESIIDLREGGIIVSSADLELAQGKRRRATEKGILNPLLMTVMLQVNFVISLR